MEKPTTQKRLTKKHKQLEIYLEYVRRYSVLKLNWVIQKGYTTELNNIWQDMTTHLNDCGGPVRDATHWKKVFTEWKSHTRRKLKYNKPLNKIEKELIDLTGLTSLPERKRKSEMVFKDKIVPDSNKPKVNRETERNDVKIKDENFDNWSDTSSTSFIEGEVIDRGSSEEVRKKNQQKIVGQEKRDENKKHIVTKENHSQTTEQLKQTETSDIMRMSASHQPIKDTLKKIDASVQVDQQIPETPIGNGLESLSRSMLTLSSAINRYCDIVERRIF